MNTESNYGPITPGHLACPGCGATLAMSWVLTVLGPLEDRRPLEDLLAGGPWPGSAAAAGDRTGPSDPDHE